MKKPLQITAIAVRQAVELIAVNHDDRRIHAPLVRIAQLGTENSVPRRRLPAVAAIKRPRELRRGQPGHGGGIRQIYRFDKFGQARGPPTQTRSAAAQSSRKPACARTRA